MRINRLDWVPNISPSNARRIINLISVNRERRAKDNLFITGVTTETQMKNNNIYTTEIDRLKEQNHTLQ